MTSAKTKTLFLPGARGSASFWRPVSTRTSLEGLFFAWPGPGNEPADSTVNGFDDFVAMVMDRMKEPVNVVAHSMGGLIAIKLALAAPEQVKCHVLAATSAGVPIADLGGSDWRPDYYLSFPHAARWIAEPVVDLSPQLGSIEAPTPLLWGNSDPISPVAVGERLRALLPNASLHVIPGGDHDLAQSHAEFVASLIERLLIATL